MVKIDEPYIIHYNYCNEDMLHTEVNINNHLEKIKLQ